jgi:valyl-tRNA synthetase
MGVNDGQIMKEQAPNLKLLSNLGETWEDGEGVSHASRIVLDEGGGAPESCGMRPVGDQCELFLSLKGMIDIEGEIKSLEKKKAAQQKSLDGLKAKMALPNYAEKVPESVRTANSAKVNYWIESCDSL